MRILISNHYLSDYAGSEITTLGLAKHFKENGFQVVVATLSYGDPIRHHFEALNIEVVNLLNDKLDECEFDVIWAHHSPILNKLILDKSVTGKKILCSILSPFEPLEAPPIYVNELDLCLVNSLETRDKMLQFGVEPDKIQLFPNSVSNEFFDAYKPHNNELKKIVVISNHVPDEIIEVAQKLEFNKVKVDIFGLYHKRELITPALLNDYDAVITIGKSVQYALALGIPVYCYDTFGGPGWITPDNLDTAEYYNFSGRCTNNKLNADTIVNEILNKYDSVARNCGILHNIAKNSYSLIKNIQKVMDKLSLMPDIDYGIFNKYHLVKVHNDYYINEFKSLTYFRREVNRLQSELNHLLSIEQSISWKVTSPLRWIHDHATKIMKYVLASKTRY